MTCISRSWKPKSFAGPSTQGPERTSQCTCEVYTSVWHRSNMGLHARDHRFPSRTFPMPNSRSPGKERINKNHLLDPFWTNHTGNLKNYTFFGSWTFLTIQAALGRGFLGNPTSAPFPHPPVPVQLNGTINLWVFPSSWPQRAKNFTSLGISEAEAIIPAFRGFPRGPGENP